MTPKRAPILALALSLVAVPAAAQIPNGSAPKLQSALTNTVVSLKGSGPASLDALHCYNAGASVAFLQIFDAPTSGSVTLGSTVPQLSIGIPAASSSSISVVPSGTALYSGLQVAATDLPADASAPASPITCNFWIR